MTRGGRTGSLLMMTLWLVTVLAVLAVAIGRYLSLDVRMTKYRTARLQARWLAHGGISLAMQRLAADAARPEADGGTYDWSGDEWAMPWADAAVSLRVTDEASKLDLNTASKSQLTGLLRDETLAQTIVDARDEPDPSEPRPEAGVPYVPKDGLFAAPEELADLPGMSGELYAILAAHATPYAANEPLNLNTASIEVLRAIGLSERTIGLITHFRDGPDGPDVHEQDGIFTETGVAVLQVLKDHEGVDVTGTDDGNLLSSRLFGVSSQTFTIVSEGVIEHPAARARVTAVVRRAGCGQGRPSPCVIAWRES